MNTMREDFEAWMTDVAKIIVGSSDPYPAGLEQSYWLVWQAALQAARQPVEFERAIPTNRRESAVKLLLELGFAWNNQRWEDRRQPVGEVVAYRLVTGDPKRKWMAVQGAPPVGVVRQAADHGWEIEYLYSAPPQQPERVDWDRRSAPAPASWATFVARSGMGVW